MPFVGRLASGPSWPQRITRLVMKQVQISHEMQRCVETKGKYFYLIRWESVEAHEVNFRQTPKRQQFRDLIGKYWAEPPFAEHFEPITNDRI
jgi:heme-degrading monooxygenase HmoA